MHSGGARIPLSIASAPKRLPELELHYKSTPGVVEARLMDEILAGSEVLQIEGPHGEVTVDGPVETPLSLIAGGTGIAQCCAIIEHLRDVVQRAPVNLLWSVADARQFYCEELLSAPSSWLTYRALVDPPGPSNAAVHWLRARELPPSGRTIVSGGPAFVYSVVDQLRLMGITDATIESDVFSYSPRRDAAGPIPHPQ